MIRYIKLSLLLSMLTTGISWSAGNSNYFPLQVGNTWNYFWGYDLPECCKDNSNQCSLLECIIEGAVTKHKIESSYVHNNRTCFVYVIHEGTFGGESRLLHKDTLYAINNCIYKYSGTEQHLWLNFNNTDSLYSFQTQPEDTFSVQYFNRQYGTFPIHSALFDIKSKLTTDSLVVTNKKIYGQFYKIEYSKADSNKTCWIENYWPGIGLAYSCTENKSRFISLESAIINGDSIKVGIKQTRFRPAFVKKSTSTDDRIFDIRGNLVRSSSLHQRNTTTPAGIYVSPSGRKMFLVKNVK